MRSVGVALLFFGLGSAQMFAAATYKLAKTIPLPAMAAGITPPPIRIDGASMSRMELRWKFSTSTRRNL